MVEPYDILALSRESHKMDIQKADSYTVRRLRRTASLLNEKSVLDVGCGCGLLHRILGEEITYVGIDFVKESLMSGKWLGFSSAHKIAASAHALPIRDNSIEAVVCSEVLEHLPYDLPEKCLLEAFRTLKDGGILILSVPNFSHLVNRLYFLIWGRVRGLNDTLHVNSFSANSLERLLKISGFKDIKRHGFDIFLEPSSLLTHLASRIPYSVRKGIANYIHILDQLIMLRASKESINENSFSPPP